MAVPPLSKKSRRNTFLSSAFLDSAIELSPSDYSFGFIKKHQQTPASFSFWLSSRFEEICILQVRNCRIRRHIPIPSLRRKGVRLDRPMIVHPRRAALKSGCKPLRLCCDRASRKDFSRSGVANSKGFICNYLLTINNQPVLIHSAVSNIPVRNMR
jgi:hypothetical protein